MDPFPPTIQICLVSAQPTPNLTPVLDDRRRADDMRIRTVIGPEIRNLKQHLAEWAGLGKAVT